MIEKGWKVQKKIGVEKMSCRLLAENVKKKVEKNLRTVTEESSQWRRGRDGGGIRVRVKFEMGMQ